MVELAAKVLGACLVVALAWLVVWLVFDGSD